PPELILLQQRLVPAGGGRPPAGAMMLRSLDDLVDLPGLQTAGTDFQPPNLASDESAERHQVGKPAALRAGVGVTDLVAHSRALPTDVATLSHPDPLEGEPGLPDAATLYIMGPETRQPLAPR